MSNIINFSSNIIHDLKDEILADIRQTENKLVDQINKKWCKIEETNNSLFEKLNLMMENTKQMFESMTVQRLRLEKISDYEPFKNKIEAMVTAHEIRINSLITDVMNIRTKYDKIISDNLTVPGFIGPSCQFKKISDYLLNNIMELSKTKNEKDQLKSDIKECRNRVDGFLKNMVNLNDSSVLRCNEYTDNKEKNIKEYVQNILENFEKKSFEMRAGLYDDQQKKFDEMKNYMNEFDDVLDMKKDINKALDKKFKEYEKELKILNEKFEAKGKEIQNLDKNFKNYDKNLKEINLIVKETQFKETVNQMDIIKINAKLKKSNYIYNNQLNKNNNNNMNNNNNNNTNNTNSNTNNNNNSINDEKYSPIKKNNKIPNTGIQMFKESILKGKTLINRRKTDDLFRLKLKESKKNVIFNDKDKDKDKEKSFIEDNSFEKEDENKLYKQIELKKYSISNEITYTITSNIKESNNNDLNININNTENNINKDKIDKIYNKQRISSTRNSKSDYKPKKNNKKYFNLLNNNDIEEYKKQLKLNNFKISKLNIIPPDNKKYRTLHSDGFISSSAKLSKGVNIKSLVKTNNLHNYNSKKFIYKIVSLGDKVSLDSDSKEFYPLDFETLKKRSIRINLVSPVSNPLKTYQNEKNKQNINNELNIKVIPAFGSTAYSFYQKKDYPILK